LIHRKARFKSKHRSDATYTVTAAAIIALEPYQLKLPKVGRVRCPGGREWEGKIKRATVRQTLTGKYYTTVLIDERASAGAANNEPDATGYRYRL